MVMMRMMLSGSIILVTYLETMRSSRSGLTARPILASCHPAIGETLLHLLSFKQPKTFVT